MAERLVSRIVFQEHQETRYIANNNALLHIVKKPFS